MGCVHGTNQSRIIRHGEESQEFLVYGFMRRIDIDQEIPEDIKQLCLSFYRILRDKWNPAISNSSLKINNETGEIYVADGYDSWKNAFGSFIIKKGDIQTWKIKITNDSSHQWGIRDRHVSFGVIEYKSNNQLFYRNMTQNAFCNCDEESAINNAYAYSTNRGDLMCSDDYRISYGTGCQKDDILSMTLDLQQTENNHYGTLSFGLNDKSLGIAFDDIDINKKYCLALAIYYSDDLQLIE